MCNGLENVLKDEVTLSNLPYLSEQGFQMKFYFIHIMYILRLTDICV